MYQKGWEALGFAAVTVKKKTRIARPAFDAFLSHASQDGKFAARIQRALQTSGLKCWMDNSDLAFGALLRDELQHTIQNNRVLVLLWSQAAFQSRWVMAEIFTAFHLDRFIVPCALDATPLPQFLQNTAYLNRRRDQADIGEKLARAIGAAPASANKVGPWLGGRKASVQSLLDDIARGADRRCSRHVGEPLRGRRGQRDRRGQAEKRRDAGAARPHGPEPRGLPVQERLHARSLG